MAVLYIEPTPGNGEGYLQKTYQALKADYQVEVVGHGYPPIFIWDGDKTEVERIAQGIDKKARVLEQHRIAQDDSAELSDPQPHEERQRPPEPNPEDTEPKPNGGSVDKDTLFDALLNNYSEDEIRVFCNPLTIDYDKIPGQGKAIKLRQLVDRLDKRRLIDQFVKEIRKHDSNAFK